MPLDTFDREVLETSGQASAILKQYYDLNISQNSARKYLTGIRYHLKHKEKMRGAQRHIGEMEEVVYKADGTQTTQRMLLLSEEEKLNPARIMELMGYDPVQWELVSCKTRRNYWDVSMKVGSKSEGFFPEKSTNHAYMCTVTVKPVQKEITSELIRRVFEELRPPKLEKYTYKPGDCMLELPILDFHLGKLAWHEETGQDYDMTIAEELFKSVILDILSRVKHQRFQVEKIVFPIGQDYFHTDTIGGTTTSGTQMDSDTRWSKMYAAGVHLLVWAVEQLRKLAPVECMWVPGNHDKALSYFATLHLSAWYHDCEGVTVDVSPTVRKYIHYGNNLIGYSHGKEEGKRISGLMQLEQPEAWSKTTYREFHLGDLHHEAAREENGIIIRRISAITGTDAWHAEKGFIGAIQKAQAFIWDKQRGNIDIINAEGNHNDLDKRHGTNMADHRETSA